MTANAAARRADRLLGFYVDKSRDLPWRSPPGGAGLDPYRVWLSEIMLQQTTVATVVPRFARFVERWPTLAALAGASDEEVLGEWAGLGYYARARNLIACARQVAAAGGFPRTAAELRKLPGLGAYTSAAIAAIAFAEDVAPIDTNVSRVIARLHAIANPAADQIERHFRDLAPTGRSGDVAQALMDVGATICRPRNPRCEDCPMVDGCLARASGTPEMFPTPKARSERPQRFGIAWWIERDGHVWLVRRPPRGLLGGMAALPGANWCDEQPEAACVMASVRHIFTHFALDLAICPAEAPMGEGWWHPLEAIGEAGLPTLYRRAVSQVLEARAASNPLRLDPA
ncbi:MAG: A/G-specific adenine glycosylase [Sphingomicrobium sp.]